MKTVSVVLPTFNSAEYLPRVIDGIARQNYPSLELIIVNDGSTDNTKEVLRDIELRYKEKKNIKRIKIIHQQNKGAPKARNEGAKHATGKYIIFAESDMILDSDMISTEIRYLKNHPKASYAYCDYSLTGRMQGELRAKPFDPETLLEMNYITGVSVMKREYFPGFDPEIKGFQDWDMFLTMMEQGHTGVHVPKILFEAIQREDGISADVHSNWNERVLTIYGKHKRVALFTLTKDRLENTKRMFDALDIHTKRYYDHYVVDQGSKDGTIEYLKDRKLKKLILNKENTGISVGSNQALDAIGDKYDYIVKIDNDCEILTDYWLAEMIKLIILGNNGAVLSPHLEDIEVYSNSVEILGHTINLADHMNGTCVIAPAHVYSNFRFDEDDLTDDQQSTSFSAHAIQNKLATGYVKGIKATRMTNK